MRVLVTGGAGFIGSHFVRIAHNVHPEWDIVVYDLLTYAGKEDRIPRGIPLIHADVCDRERLYNASRGADWIVHFAAESHVDGSFEDPSLYFKTNGEGTLSVLEAARKSGCKLLHISSSEVYGSRRDITIDSPLRPCSPYAASKAAGDCLVQSYVSTFGIEAYIARPFNAYGPGQHIEKVIPRFITQALSGEPITIHGTGEATRTFVYVEDIARRLLYTIADAPSVPLIFNIGNCNEWSVKDIAHRVAQELGAKMVHVDDRPGQVKYQSCVDDFESSIDHFKDTIEWYRDKYNVQI